ncbi:MAG: HAD-IA family hydrolase [Candidatus Dormibacteraceae bacterium]
MINWVVFDYGGVISRRTAALPRLAARLGVDVGVLFQAYWQHRGAYDAGEHSDFTYWQAIGEELGVVIDQATAVELTNEDMRGWLETDPEALELLEDLQESGMALALLSNAPGSLGREIERQPWAWLLRQRLFSADLGVTKPDKPIWLKLLRTLDAKAPECLFFDDLQNNVDGALAVGLRAECWSGAAPARMVLNDLGLLHR